MSYSGNTQAPTPAPANSNSARLPDAVKLTVPWSTIGAGENPPLGRTIGFDLAVDDDSDGGERNAQVVVFGTGDNYLSTSAWGEITVN